RSKTARVSRFRIFTRTSVWPPRAVGLEISTSRQWYGAFSYSKNILRLISIASINPAIRGNPMRYCWRAETRFLVLGSWFRVLVLRSRFFSEPKTQNQNVEPRTRTENQESGNRDLVWIEGERPMFISNWTRTSVLTVVVIIGALTAWMAPA